MEIKEVKLNTIPPQLFSPPVATAKSKQANNKSPMKADEALELLKLVNVGKNVLDVSSLNMSDEELCIIAENIKSARKNNLGVEFENGRINVPENLWESIIKGCKKAPETNLLIGGYSKPQIEYKKL